MGLLLNFDWQTVNVTKTDRYFELLFSIVVISFMFYIVHHKSKQSYFHKDQLNAQSEQGDQSAVVEQLQQQLTQQGSSHQAVVEELQQQLTMSRQQEESRALEIQTYQGQISDLTNQMYQLRTASVQVLL